MNDIAAQKANPLLINVLAVGAFVEKTGILKMESVKYMLEKLTSKRRELLPDNLRSLDAGAQYVKELVGV
jgi:2-oxoglutarate ferredoxin oxidoreductase subunit gamma